jgi:hypothetical protein
MGLFCANFHFRTDDHAALSAAAAKRKFADCRVLPAKNGWVSLYDERSSQQDDERIRDLAKNLSKDLKTPAIAFMVHDSDIACYWLYDSGKLLDEFNSSPDYFDDDGGTGAPASGGKTTVLIRFCRPGVTEEQLAEILHDDPTFAESIVERLVDALGIDPGRALADYRDGGGGPDEDGDDEEEGGFGGGPRGGMNAEKIRGMMAGRMAQMFGVNPNAPPADPQVQALVDAAVRGDVAEIKQLLDAGVEIDEQAPAPLANQGGVALVDAQSVPKVPMTPLIAAVAHKQRPAVELLLGRGADPNQNHPVFGTALHSATGMGEAETLQLLIDRGGDVTAANSRGQTPMQIIAASRAIQAQMEQAQALMKSMGMKGAGLAGKLSMSQLPIEGWAACEEILKSHGAQ